MGVTISFYNWKYRGAGRLSQGNKVEVESGWVIRAASPSAVCQVETLAVGPRSRTGKLRGRGLSSSERDMGTLGIEGPPLRWGSQTAGCRGNKTNTVCSAAGLAPVALTGTWSLWS